MRSGGELREMLDLPSLPDGWTWKRLSELVEPRRGICYGIVQPGKHHDDGVPMVNSQNILNGAPSATVEFKVAKEIHDRFKRSTIRGGEILLTLVGANFGRSAIAPLHYAGFNCSRAVGIIPVLGNARYVMYCLQSPITRRFLDDWANTTAQPTFNLKEASELPIPIPSKAVQDEIAELLGAIDDKIMENRRTIHALEGLARAMFKAWFTDFEPVKAKAAGAAGYPGMLGATFADLPDHLHDSPLGLVPQGWAAKSVSETLTLSKQQTNPQDHAHESFEHFSLPAYDAGQYPVIEPGSEIKSQKFVLAPGCVLLSKLNPRIPRVWLPSPASGRRQIASTEFLVAVPKEGWTRELLFCLFQQDDFRQSLAQSASGTSNSHQRVRPSDLLTRQLVMPPRSMLDAFTEQAAPQMALREALHTESFKLSALRDYLLPLLLSGRVRVRTAIAAVGRIN